MTQKKLGFNEWFQAQLEDLPEGLVVARVIAVHKGECEVSDGETTAPAKMTGNLRHRAKSRMDYPTVGDWVLVKHFAEEAFDFGLIQSVLQRKTALRRKTAGRTVRHQLIAANIDTAFLMQALGPGFSLPRIERYLVMANESGIDPIILLSKRDLLNPEELKTVLFALQERIPNTPVYAFSNLSKEGLKEVQNLFLAGKTHCVVGTSGVGKTSLLNTMLDEDEERFTLPVREKDGKGVHSTTWRELIVLENGALVVDTPGMRELGHLDAEEGIQETFDDISALAMHCRFNDCAHVNTPGCAVLEAVECGEIPATRYQNFIRLMEESAILSQAVLDQKGKNKALRRFHKSMKNKG